jgi:hypothetical protein
MKIGIDSANSMKSDLQTNVILVVFDKEPIANESCPLWHSA